MSFEQFLHRSGSATLGLPGGESWFAMKLPDARTRVRILLRVEEILMAEWFLMPECRERDERLAIFDEVKELRFLIEAGLGAGG